MDLRKLRDEAKRLRPVMAIGKQGITQGSVQLLGRELEQKGLVKVKLLRSHLAERDRHAAAAELAALGQATLVQVVGNVVVLYKAGKAR